MWCLTAAGGGLADEPCGEAPGMTRVRYAAIGCSGMGRGHLHGLARLLSSSHANIELAAVCDLDLGLANAMAEEAAALTGARAQVFSSIAEMARQDAGIAAANVTTDAGSHLAVSLQCFAAGPHVLCQQPLRLTVGECRAVIDVARKAGRVPSVADNFRRDPMHRLVKALPERLLYGRDFEYVSTFIFDRIYDHQGHEFGDIEVYARALAQPGRTMGGLEWFRAFGTDHADALLWKRERLTTPLLALGGDRRWGANIVDMLKKFGSNVRGGSSADCNHWLPEECPTETGETLMRFLSLASN